eukprot:1158648-Pelagomonas_calceolata.AAC.2
MDSTSGWFSTKLKALVPLLVSGQPLSQAQHVPVCPVSAVAGLPKWRGSAMVFAERKPNSCHDERPRQNWKGANSLGVPEH